jgi:hypothetical protein
MTDKKQHVHLICNAHLDPVWLWEWPEAAAEVAVDVHNQVGNIFNWFGYATKILGRETYWKLSK